MDKQQIEKRVRKLFDAHKDNNSNKDRDTDRDTERDRDRDRERDRDRDRRHRRLRYLVCIQLFTVNCSIFVFLLCLIKIEQCVQQKIRKWISIFTVSFIHYLCVNCLYYFFVFGLNDVITLLISHRI